MLVLDLPAPAGVHRFGQGIRLDRLMCPLPPTDDRAITKQGVLITNERFSQRTAKQLRPESRAIDIQISGDSLAVFRDECPQTLAAWRSEEHTSELQSPDHLVCRLLLEKKNK